MKISRQGERWARFQALFRSMPMWETWTTEQEVLLWEHPRQIAMSVKAHCKVIPRRVRRDMARQRAKREFQASRLIL